MLELPTDTTGFRDFHPRTSIAPTYKNKFPVSNTANHDVTMVATTRMLLGCEGDRDIHNAKCMSHTIQVMHQTYAYCAIMWGDPVS